MIVTGKIRIKNNLCPKMCNSILALFQIIKSPFLAAKNNMHPIKILFFLKLSNTTIFYREIHKIQNLYV